MNDIKMYEVKFSGRQVALTIGAHAQLGLRYLFCVSVTTFSGTTHNEGTTYVKVGCCNVFILKKGDFRKTAAFKSYCLKTKRK